MSKRIPLTQGKFAIVDDEDYEWLNQWKWCAYKSRNTYYALKYENGKAILMHRLILNAPSGMETDHRNHKGFDNRRKNIRVCTTAQNQHNQIGLGRGGSRYKGVSRGEKSWYARLTYKNKSFHLGAFDTEKEAALAYDEKAKELFGEFANINNV